MTLYLSLAGKLIRAVEAGELALNQPSVDNSKWYAQVVGQRVEVAAAAVAPDVIDTARQRGRALELWPLAEMLLNELQQGTQQTEPFLSD
jgi:hypothetical protein